MALSRDSRWTDPCLFKESSRQHNIPFAVMILRSQVATSGSQSEESCSQVGSRTTQSHKRSTSRRILQSKQSSSSQHDSSSDVEDAHMKEQAILDMRAADECMDQTHIYDDPAWRVIDLDSSLEECSTKPTGQGMPGGLDPDSNPQLAGTHYEYKEQHDIVFFKLCPKEKRWLDLGPGVVTIEGGMYASTITVRMENTFRVLATWNIFGGMKVIRFLSTVIVLAFAPDDEGAHMVVSYGLKLATLEEAKGLAILLSSTTRGLQMNMKRLVPRCSAAKRAKILEIMADRLIVLKRRLGDKQDSELSVLVETELAGMLSTSTGLTR
ncbi:hypothetical protein B0J17DRAFT_766192 [Rhizoctonia solani]|nr:hypothetical protein B0J17DRAFT_766192 [Rhizoctonia solani]